MRNITPCLWFDGTAEEAAGFYSSIFKDGSVGEVVPYNQAGAEVSGQPKGTTAWVYFTIAGMEMLALNGGPQFKFTPATSFHVGCSIEEEIDELWAKLSEGGTVMMEYQEYPFSEKYGWCQDRFGLSWQLNLTREQQKITPALLFVGENFGRAEEAMEFYTSRLDDSGIDSIDRYGALEPDEGKVAHASFHIAGTEFMAMESGLQHEFDFTLAMSFIVNCDTQEEVDRLWESMSAEGGEKSVCGWLTDKYGVAWQIIPAQLDEMLASDDEETNERVSRALYQMTKIDIGELERVRQAA